MEKIGFVVLWSLAVVALVASTTSYFVFSSRGYNTTNYSFTKTEEVDELFDVDIILARWTFMTWIFVYLWQAVWIVYALTLIIRKSQNGRMYYAPPFFNQWIFLLYILAALCNIGWNILWSLRCVQYAFIFIVLIPILLCYGLGLSFRGIRKHGIDIAYEFGKKELVFILLFLQYGIGMYAVWAIIAAAINLSMILHYYAGVAMETGSSISLAILSAMFLVWFVIDNFVFEKTFRYFAIPYYVTIYALIAMISRNYRSGAQNSIFSIVLMVVIVILFIIKIVYSSLRSKKHPLYDWGDVEKVAPSDDKELNSVSKMNGEPQPL